MGLDMYLEGSFWPGYGLESADYEETMKIRKKLLKKIKEEYGITE